jgi:hypothetical protein
MHPSVVHGGRQTVNTAVPVFYEWVSTSFSYCFAVNNRYLLAIFEGNGNDL